MPVSYRYERVKAVQKTGETTRDMWHKTDWEKVREDPTSIALPREDWIHFHDTEKHAEDVFQEVFQKHVGATANGDVKGADAPYVEHAETVAPTITT